MTKARFLKKKKSVDDMKLVKWQVYSNDNVVFYYMRCVLHVKATTSNVIVIGESCQIPQIVYFQINALCYLKRFRDLPDTNIAKQAYITNWIDSTNVVWRHWSPKHENWPKNTRSIFHLIFKISKNNCEMTISNCINSDFYWRLRILTETQSYEHVQCSKRNSIPRNILKSYLAVTIA